MNTPQPLAWIRRPEAGATLKVWWFVPLNTKRDPSVVSRERRECPGRVVGRMQHVHPHVHPVPKVPVRAAVGMAVG